MGVGGLEGADSPGSTFSKNVGHRRMLLESYGQRLGKFRVRSGTLLREKYTKDAKVFASGWTKRRSDRAMHLSGSFCRKRDLLKQCWIFWNVLEWAGSNRGSCLIDSFSFQYFFLSLSLFFFVLFHLSSPPLSFSSFLMPVATSWGCFSFEGCAP